MKKLISILSFITLLVSAVSCQKNDSGFNPYYQVSSSFRLVSSLGSEPDFENLFSVIDSYVNKRVDTEKEAIAMLDEIVAKTKNVSWHANEGSYVQISISKLVVKRHTETTVVYDFDDTYRSPKSHIWDAQGSRDL